MRNHYKLILLWVLCFSLLSCNKFVEVDPPVTNPASNAIYENDATAIAVLTGLYSQLMQTGNGLSGGSFSITTLTALNSDELRNYSVNVVLTQSYTNALRNTSAVNFWNDLYKYIYISNAAIEGLTGPSKVSGAVKQQLIGEAKFLRAFFYFYLVNLYGEVPLLLKTDYRINSIAVRTPINEVYAQIISDLKEAQELLNENYVGIDLGTTTTEKVRPNKAAATALLARAYLYAGEWANAEAEASKVISSQKYSLVTNLNAVFKKNSLEAIWQLQPVQAQFNTHDAASFILTSAPGSNHFFSITNNLMSAFEPADARKSNWTRSLTSGATTYYYPYKYQVNAAAPAAEYLMVLRLAELYLIRAEARARQEKIADAKADLNVIRTRAQLPATTADTKDALVSAVENERQLELFTEWGHRWFDLKRLGRISAVMSVVTPQKGGTWNPNWQLYPIPQNEVILNPNLRQNDDY